MFAAIRRVTPALLTRSRWARLATHPCIVSVAIHAAIVGALWSGLARPGPRGPAPSPGVAAVRADAAVTLCEPAMTPPPDEDEVPTFEAEATAAVEPVPSVAPTVEPDPVLDEAPAPDVLAGADDEPTEATRDDPVLLSPGRPIPRLRPARPAAPAPRVEVAAGPAPLPSPAPPPRPTVAIRTGGGNGLRPPVPDPFNVEPAYPADARGERGRVLLLLRVSADGLVTEVRIVESSGSGALDRAAVEAARAWRFRPATRDDGMPIASAVRRGVTFR